MRYRQINLSLKKAFMEISVVSSRYEGIFLLRSNIVYAALFEFRLAAK